MNDKLKFVLMMCGLITIIFLVTALQLVEAQEFSTETKNDFKVEWFNTKADLTSDEWVIAIQNLDENNARDFNLNFLMEDIEYNVHGITITGLYEWKNISYKRTIVQEVDKFVYPEWNTANTTSCNSIGYINFNTTNCVTTIKDYDISYEDATKLDWKKTKNRILREENEGQLKENYPAINIPKLNSKQKDATVNGTKYFKLTYDKPIEKTTGGYGSDFNLLLESQGFTYHPFVFTGWNFKKDLDCNGLNFNCSKQNMRFYQNITFDFSDILTGNLTKELRFTRRAANDSETEIGFTIVNNGTDWANITWTLQGINYNYSFYYGNASAEKSSLYGTGGEHYPNEATIALYHFDSDYTDASPNGYDATGIGTSFVTECLGFYMGGCVLTDGSTDLVNLTTGVTNADWDLGDSGKSFTLIIYINASGASSNANLATRWHHASGDRSWIFGADDIATEELRMRVSNDGTNTIASNGFLGGGTFFMKQIAFVFDNPNNELRTYVDGGQVPVTVAKATNVHPSNLAISIIGDDGDGAGCNECYFDEVWYLEVPMNESSLIPSGVSFTEGARQSFNSAPSQPLLASPLNASTIGDKTPQMEWFNSTDSDDDAVSYSIEVWNDTLMTQFAYLNVSISEQGINQTNVTIPTDLLDGDYFWRVNATDGTLSSAYSENFTFTIQTLPTVTTPVISPATIDNLTDVNVSTVVSDFQSDTMTIDIRLFADGLEVANISTEGISNGTNVTVLFAHGNYSHFVNLIAEAYGSDASGTGTFLNSTQATVINTNPTIPTVLFPVSNFTQTNQSITLTCSNASDLDNDTLFYQFFQQNTDPPTDLKSNATDTTIQVDNLLGNPLVTYFWRCQTNDQVGGNSTFTEIRNFTIDVTDVKTAVYGFNTITFETSLETFTANITYNNLLLENVTANFMYNSTNFTVVESTETNGTRRFNITIGIPDVFQSINKTFNWTFTNIFYNGSRGTNVSDNLVQEIRDTKLLTCAAGNSSHEIIAEFPSLLEPNRTALLTNFEANFDIYIGNVSVSSKVSIDSKNITLLRLCGFPIGINWTTDAEINYFTSSTENLSSEPRQNYLRTEALNGTNIFNRSLFLLPSIVSDDITFELLDKNSEGLIGHYLGIERKNFVTGSFFQVAIGKTDNDGKTTIPLERVDAFYRFKIFDGIKLLKTTVDTQIITTELEILVAGLTQGELFNQFGEVGFTLAFNNDTKQFTLVFSDPNSQLKEGCLRVVQYDFGSEGILFDDCVTGTTGNLAFTIPNNESSYSASFYGSINPQSLIDTIYVNLVQSFASQLGLDGVVASMFLVMTLALLGSWNPAVAVSFGVVAIIFSAAFGLIILSVGAVIGLIVVGAIFAFKLRT